METLSAYFKDNEIYITIILFVTMMVELIILMLRQSRSKRHKRERERELSTLYRRFLDDYTQQNQDVYYRTLRKLSEDEDSVFNKQYNFYYDYLERTVSRINSSQKKMLEEFEKLSLLLSSTGIYNISNTNQQGIDAVVMLKQISEMTNIDYLLELMKDQTENKLVITNNVISEIAHTIRTPISGIHAILLMLESKTDLTNEQLSTYIQKIKDSLHQIEQNLQAYRDLMTETLDEQIIVNQSFVEKLTSRLRGSILSCNKRLYINSNAIDPIELDNEIANLLLLAFDCIVENATYFATDNSTIRITGKSDESCYTFTIENDGPQIGDDIAKRVFDHGFSSHSSSGKGLFLVKRVIQDRLGGDVDFENITVPTAGVRFIIVLDKNSLTKKEGTPYGENSDFRK